MKNLMEKLLKLIFSNEVFFVGSADKLPEPLTKEEEVSNVLKSMEGDLEARQLLIEHNLRLVVFLAKKYENTGLDLEDLVSIGCIGLIKGVNTYKLDRNIKLATYVSRCIDNEILMCLRKNKRRKSEISFEDSLTFDAEGNELRLEDILGTEHDIVTSNLERTLERQLLYKEVEKLKPRDKQIMILRYGLYQTNELTQKEVASLLGISQSYISRIEKKAISRFKSVNK